MNVTRIGYGFFGLSSVRTNAMYINPVRMNFLFTDDGIMFYDPMYYTPLYDFGF